MRKRLFYTIAIVVIGLAAFFFLFIYDGIVVKSDEFVIKNDKGELIDATLYKGDITFDNGNVKPLFLIHFNEVKSTQDIILMLSEEIVALPVYGNESFYKLTNRYLIRTRKGRHFKDMNNGFDDLRCSFSDSIVRFETFLDLKKFGEEIVLEKN